MKHILKKRHLLHRILLINAILLIMILGTIMVNASDTKQRNKTVVCGDVVFFFKISYNNYIRHKNIPMEVVIFRVYARYGG